VSQDINQWLNILKSWNANRAFHESRRLWSQPDAELGDDAQVALQEETLNRRTESKFRQEGRGRAGDAELSRTYDISIREQHLKPGN
jgi:hypothetical protein